MYEQCIKLLVLLTLLPNYGLCTPLDLALRTFNYETLQNFSLTNFPSILHPPTFLELAITYGHPAEAHEVITEDGYILTVFHIPGSRPSLPILLFHGLMDSADTWIIRGETSMAVTFANRNYDIWLGNVRGNRYSRRHRVLDPDTDPEFWNFSFHENGVYDLAATIDYVLNKTGAPKLNMYGHSQGNVMMWVLLSTRTEYNAKLNLATALAPIAFLEYMPPVIATLIKLVPILYKILQSLGVTSLFGDNSKETVTLRLLSRIPVIGYLIVIYGMLFPVCGYDGAELGPNFFMTLILHFPTWASVKNYVHYAQVSVRNTFGRFDYGLAGNQLAYNSPIPPVYNLTNVSTRVVLMAAANDWLAPLADVERLRKQLPNVLRYEINPRLVMNHIDFVWGRNVATYLYGYIFDILDNYG